MTHFFAGTSGQAMPVAGLLGPVMALNDGTEIRLYRADQKLNSGRWQAAWNEMSRHPAIKCDRPEATKLWMDTCIALRKWSLGEKFGKLLVEQDPSKFGHWLYYGMCAEKARGVQGRFDVYSGAVEHHPYDGYVHYSLAKAFCGLGRIDEGREALALGLALDPYNKQFAMDEPVFSEIWEDFVELEERER
jgi:tetratricopeptide (TPR) repeat protein